MMLVMMELTVLSVASEPSAHVHLGWIECRSCGCPRLVSVEATRTF